MDNRCLSFKWCEPLPDDVDGNLTLDCDIGDMESWMENLEEELYMLKKVMNDGVGLIYMHMLMTKRIV